MKGVKKMVLVPFDDTKKPAQDQPIDEELILASMPKTLKKKAEALLRYIRREVRWNRHGELEVNGEAIVGSHIADLIRYSLREYGDAAPKGYAQFLEILQRLNVPKSVVTQQKSYLPKRTSKNFSWQKI